MVHHLPILLTLILDIIANVQVPIGVCLTAESCTSPSDIINGQHQHVRKLHPACLIGIKLVSMCCVHQAIIKETVLEQ